MHIVKNIQNFLMDQDYYIDIFHNCVHVYYYLELVHLSDTFIELKLKEFNLSLIGKNFLVSKMDQHEILIKGDLEEMRFLK